MPERPDFINTASQRKQEDSDVLPAVREHYRRLYSSRFVYYGFPDDMPEGWPDECLFDVGGVGVKDSGIGRVVLSAVPVLRNVYGKPLSWVPSEVYATGRGLPWNLMEESDSPALWVGGRFAGMIEHWLEVISTAMKTLHVNIAAMTTPVAVAGCSGLELNAYANIRDLKDGKIYIPTTTDAAAGISVIDLKVTDHTQALVNTIRAADAHILTMMGVLNAGTGRESGVTSEETGSISQELSMVMRHDLAQREDWCRRLSAYFGETFSVEVSPEWQAYMVTPEQQTEQAQEASDDGDAEEDRGSE